MQGLTLTAEEWEALKASPPGRKLLKQLSEIRDQYKEEVSLGGCLNAESVGDTALNYATMVGVIRGLDELLEYQPKEFEED